MHHEDAELPEFATGLRGYDRGQVDDYVAALRGYLEEAHERALTAEAALAHEHARVEEPAGSAAPSAGAETTTDALMIDPAHGAVAGLGDRVAVAVRATLTAAEQAAQELRQAAAEDREVAARERDRVEADAQEHWQREEASTSRLAEQMLGEARLQAEALLDQARAEQAAMLSTTEEHVASLRQRADQEQARRDDALRQLRALREALASVTGTIDVAPVAALAQLSVAEQPTGEQVVGGAAGEADRTTVVRLPA